jgi:hypothetical protein
MPALYTGITEKRELDMKPIAKIILYGIFGLFIFTGCDLAPTPAPTAIPTITPTPEASPTITPTLGPREFINAVYCWVSPIDDGEFNLLRFFGDGTVLDATVAPFGSCGEAWGSMQEYMIVERMMDFGHGEYYMSGDVIRFELAPPNASEIVGEAFGEFSGGKLILEKGGATQEYEQVQ